MFTRAYTNSPGCAPSRSSMIMGLYPHHSGRYGFERTHNEHTLATPSIPQRLRQHGYQTATFGKKGYYIFAWEDGLSWTDLGFFDVDIDKKNVLQKNALTDYFKFKKKVKGQTTETVEQFYFPDGSIVENFISQGDKHAESPYPIDSELDILRAYTRSSPDLIIGGVSPQPAGKTMDGHIAKAFEDYLKNSDQHYSTPYAQNIQGPESSKPLMVHLSFHLPHTPVLPPKSFREKFKKKKYKIPHFSKKELEKLPKQLTALYGKMTIDDLTDDEKQQAIRDYYAFCAYGDYLIGESVDAFKRYNEKLQQEYLIVLTVGDHGWHLGEQGIEAKFAPWDKSNRGAIIVVDSSKKDFPQNTVYQDFVEYVDIAPTLFSAANINNDQNTFKLDGVDLSKVLQDPSLKRDYVIGEMNHVVGPRAYLRSKDFAFSMKVRKKNAKPGPNAAPGENIQWAAKAPAKDVEMALYDLRCDADERNNVAHEKHYAKITRYLRKKLTDIVLGDGRVEVDWNQLNRHHISNYAPGAHDGKLDGIEKLLIPCDPVKI